MRLYFIRHGQSSNNALYDLTQSNLGRDEDPELSEIGRRQVTYLAQFLSQGASGPASENNKSWDPQNRCGFGLTHLYTSPMVRAVATGTVVAQALQLPLRMWKELHEGGGIFLEDITGQVRTGLPGKNRTYFENHYPRLILPENLGPEGWWNRPFEEESDRRERASSVLHDLLARHADTDDSVAFFSHGGFYNYFMTTVLGLTKPDGVWFSINNAGITRIDFRSGEKQLVYQNRLDFLPSELVT